jgi:hypothetical protein
MRRFILIAAMVLISASAQAGGSRGLTMASNDEPAVAEQPKTAETAKAEAPKAETQKADAPKFVERPAVVEPTADQPKADLTKADLTKPVFDKKAEKPKHKRESTEARVIYELHRHGIYW